MPHLALNFPQYGLIDEDLSFTGETLNLANKTPGEIISQLLPYIFVIAGLILFAMLIAGGFTIFLSAGNPDKIKKGTGMIVNALVGYIIIFIAYWIIEILEFTLGITVL